MKRRDKSYTDNLSSFFRQNSVCLGILFVGLTLRLEFIHYQGLSNDELSAWYRTRFDSWQSFWQLGVKSGDMHPVAYQFLLYCWLKIFGDSEWSIRSLSLVFYVANTLLIQRIAERFFTKQAGWILNALYAVLTFMIIHTTISRPYNSGVFFLLMAFYLLLGMSKSNRGWLKSVLLLGGAFAGAMLSHYFAFLVATVFGFAALFFLQGKQRIYVLLSGVLAVLIFLPHLPVTLYQLNRGGLGWLAPPEATWLIEFLGQLFNYSWVPVALFILFFVYVCSISEQLRWDRSHYFSLIVGLSSILMGYVISYLFTPVMRELVMLFVLPFILLPLFAIPKFSQKDNRPLILTGLMLFIFGFHSTFSNGLFKPIHFGVFRELGLEIDSYERRYGSENIDFAINTNNVSYLNYYMNRSKTESIKDWFASQSFDQLKYRLERSKRKFFCYVFNNQYDQPKFRELIRTYYPQKVDEFVSPGSAVYLYKKCDNDGKCLDSGLHPKQHLSSKKLDATSNEFAGDIRLKVSQLKLLDAHDYYLFKCNLQCASTDELYTVVCLTRNGETVQVNRLPLYYQAVNQRKVWNDTLLHNVTMPFQVPKDALPGDEVLYYIWNPKKRPFCYSRASLFEVK
jgi:uncharacterized membrane protein